MESSMAMMGGCSSAAYHCSSSIPQQSPLVGNDKHGTGDEATVTTEGDHVLRIEPISDVEVSDGKIFPNYMGDDNNQSCDPSGATMNIDSIESHDNDNTDSDGNRRNCNPYDGNREALGWALDSVPRGVTIMGAAVFVSVAILGLSKKAAGCETEPLEGETIVPECNKRVYGMKPSSILTMIMLIVGVVSACLMPLVGAIIDHTKYRRAVGRISAAVMTAMIFVQIFISEKTWFLVAILQVFIAFSFCVHTLVVFAYLPEVTSDKKKLVRYTATFTMVQYFSMMIFLVTMVGIASLVEIDDVASARISQIFVFSVCILFFGTAWAILFGERPASQKCPEGSNLLTAGFKKLWNTAQSIFSQNAALKWFLVSVSFSESAVSSFNTVAITYMTDQLQFNAKENGIAILILLISSIPGSKISTYVTNRWSPIRSLQVSLAIWIINTSIAAVVLTGAGKQIPAYIFAVGWGVATGWIYPTERATYCQMIPKGEGAGHMGVYLCSCQVLSWLPPLVFTAMNEAGVQMRISFASINLFFFISFCLLFMIGNFEKVVERVKMSEKNLHKTTVGLVAPR